MKRGIAVRIARESLEDPVSLEQILARHTRGLREELLNQLKTNKVTIDFVVKTSIEPVYMGEDSDA